MEEKIKLPTEIVELPTKGLLYAEDSPLSKGEIELKYMTAKEEDILSNQNYITDGTVIDRLLKSLIVDKNVNYNDIIIGDKNAIMIAARILAYGKDYQFKLTNGETQEVDLNQIEPKEVDYSLYKDRKNEFTFTLPKSQSVITLKLLTHGDEQSIDREIKGLKKIDKKSSTDVTTRLKYMITSVDGMYEKKDVREFVDKYLLAQDARAIREFYGTIAPDVDLTYYSEDREEEMSIPIGINFFWPDARV